MVTARQSRRADLPYPTRCLRARSPLFVHLHGERQRRAVRDQRKGSLLPWPAYLRGEDPKGRQYTRPSSSDGAGRRALLRALQRLEADVRIGTACTTITY